MADDLDMENRDPNDINPHLKVAFEDILGEPEAVRSFDCVWRCSYKCFNCTLSCCYKLLTVLCAVPMSFCWAIQFAYTACAHVWGLTPCILCYAVWMSSCKRVYMICLRSFLGPMCETCGLCLSRIAVAKGEFISDKDHGLN